LTHHLHHEHIFGNRIGFLKVSKGLEDSEWSHECTGESLDILKEILSAEGTKEIVILTQVIQPCGRVLFLELSNAQLTIKVLLEWLGTCRQSVSHGLSEGVILLPVLEGSLKEVLKDKLTL
jgi:hypothetical protein